MIAAIDNALGVANDRGIPWQGRIPMDASRYRDLTSNGIILMGYGTYKEYEKPLHDRENFVVTRPDSGELKNGFVAVTDLASFLRQQHRELIWAIGGAALFEEVIRNADELYLTRLDADFHCTKFFPKFSPDFQLASDDGPHVQSGISFRFQTWHRTRA